MNKFPNHQAIRAALKALAILGAALISAPTAPAAPFPQEQPRAEAPKHVFDFKGTEFRLDGKPFQIMAGEMHFQRIPRPYWKDRLLKAKAMGLNTIATYIFWNALEPEPDQWDFSDRNDLAGFLEEAQKASLWVLLRPGPYACAEWDFGGLPAWLLRTPDIKVRCMDDRYLEACDKYVEKIAGIIRPFLVQNGGPILMVQIENEYGSFGNDRGYIRTLKGMWERFYIDGPFYTADGATPYMLEAGSIPGCAIGLDPAASEAEFAEGAKVGGGEVPIFCSELYPGWFTPWGEPWGRTKTEDVVKDLTWLLENKKSFNLYVVHGGTNFGFWAGANMGKTYTPDVTSYDYDAPINERGDLTPKYFAIRDLLAKYQPAGAVLPEPPGALPAIEVPEIAFPESAGLFENLPFPTSSPQPKPMEFFNQSYGFILYRTELIGRHAGTLAIHDLHDYANIYLDGKYLGTLDRAKGENTIEIPKSDPPARILDILVEGMGRVNYGPEMIDRKGITDRVTLANMTLMNWEVTCLPMDDSYLAGLKFEAKPVAWPAVFFRGSFELKETGDTYLDMSGWKKGVVWVNGRNLGRYWDIGPQKRLFCPASFLKEGRNEVIVFDLHRTEPATVRGYKTLE